MTEGEVRRVLGAVSDPEIPTLSIVDLGIVREVHVTDQRVRVVITPTYSGCPAMEMIEREVIEALRSAGLEEVEVARTLSPPWTTEWITDDGKRKLREAGIAPPSELVTLGARAGVRCPRCNSVDTSEQSHFGSTACKALYVCKSCLEVFEYFKKF